MYDCMCLYMSGWNFQKVTASNKHGGIKTRYRPVTEKYKSIYIGPNNKYNSRMKE